MYLIDLPFKGRTPRARNGMPRAVVITRVLRGHILHQHPWASLQSKRDGDADGSDILNDSTPWAWADKILRAGRRTYQSGKKQSLSELSREKNCVALFTCARRAPESSL